MPQAAANMPQNCLAIQLQATKSIQNLLSPLNQSNEAHPLHFNRAQIDNSQMDPI